MRFGKALEARLNALADSPDKRLVDLATVFVGDEDEEDEALETLQFYMRDYANTKPLWLAALRIDDDKDMEEALTKLGFKTRSDLEKAGILPKEGEAGNAEAFVIDKRLNYVSSKGVE